ncbi:MAG TPA: alpha/beta hydrolase [Ktedonobacterales bacterium]|nr:alpha/beta hydrolase [Ktedonobacterales bacterium]
MADAQQAETGFAPVNGAKLYYEIAGSGRPLVLLHAGLADSRMWDDQFSAFARQCRVVRYDLRGFGKSDLPAEPYSHSADLYGLLQFLGIQQAALMGVSLGGSTIIDFTLQRPEMVEALIPVASGLSGYPETDDPANTELEKAYAEVEAAIKAGDIASAAEGITRIWTDGPNRAPDQVNSRVRGRVKAMTVEWLSRTKPKPEPKTVDLKPPALIRLKEIQVPTLIVVGDQDVLDILVIADLLQKHIPHAETLVIPGAAHMLTMEQPEQVNQAVLRFLQQ